MSELIKGTLNKQKNKGLTIKQINTIKTIIKYAVMIIIALVVVLPFYWMVLVSFRPEAQIFKTPISWLPNSFTTANFKEAFKKVNFPRAFWNTFFLTAVNIATNLGLGSLAAYAIAKIRFKGHNILFRIMMMSMMIPGIVLIVPTYNLIETFGLLNTHLGVLLPGTVGVYCIFFLRQFFITLSDELGEAARIDGAGELRIFWQIYLPLILPAITTLFIFCFQGSWNSYLWPNLVLLSSNNLKPVMVVLYDNSFRLNAGSNMAATLIVTLPIIVIFIFAQKYFIGGLSAGGVKG